MIRKGLQYKDEPDVAVAALAPGNDTTECTAIKIHDPRARNPITLVNVYVPPFRASDGRNQGFDPDFLPVLPDTFILGDLMLIGPLGTRVGVRIQIIIIIIYLPAKHDTVHKVETNILSARHTRLIEHLQ